MKSQANVYHLMPGNSMSDLSLSNVEYCFNKLPSLTASCKKSIANFENVEAIPTLQVS